MITVEKIYKDLTQLAPENKAEDWDPVGPQIYFPEEAVKGLVLALDVTDQVLDFALEKGANVIVSHHPMYFNPIRRFDQRTYQGKFLERAIERKISVLSAHTNLDRASGGVNDALAQALDLRDLEEFAVDEEKGNMGYIGRSNFKSLEDLKVHIEEKIRPHHILAYGRKKEKIDKIALLGGSGADLISLAKAKGADLYITGDVKYHDGQKAYEEGLFLLDLGHFDTEKFVLEKLKELFAKEVGKVYIYPKSDFYVDF